MDTLPSAVLTHCLNPFLSSKDVGALAQTSKKMHAARNYTTAIRDAGGWFGLLVPLISFKLRCGREASSPFDTDDNWVRLSLTLIDSIPRRQLLTEIDVIHPPHLRRV